MENYKQYKRKGLSEMRPYVPGEDLAGISVSPEDEPELGGMIARNPKNHDDKWYVAKKYFDENLEESGEGEPENEEQCDTPEKQEEVPPEVAQTKQWRKDLDMVLQKIKEGSNVTNPPVSLTALRTSRERSLCITKIQEGIMWLGMDLKAQKEEGINSEKSPYKESYNPKSATIEPTADSLKL